MGMKVRGKCYVQNIALTDILIQISKNIIAYARGFSWYF